jgi:hypothetical protein
MFVSFIPIRKTLNIHMSCFILTGKPFCSFSMASLNIAVAELRDPFPEKGWTSFQYTRKCYGTYVRMDMYGCYTVLMIRHMRD